MLRRIRSWFAWRMVRAACGWVYWENTITGQRAVRSDLSGGYRPIDFYWLKGGRGFPLIDGKPFTEGRG